MRVNPDYALCNAAAQIADQGSVYKYWSSMLSLRLEYKDVLVYGTFNLIDEANPSVFAFERTSQRGRALIILNWSSQAVQWVVPLTSQYVIEQGSLMQSNYSREEIILQDDSIELFAWEAAVFYIGTRV